MVDWTVIMLVAGSSALGGFFVGCLASAHIWVHKNKELIADAVETALEARR